MNEVSSFRIYVLRALYLFIVVGLCLLVWPGINVLKSADPWSLPFAGRTVEAAQ